MDSGDRSTQMLAAPMHGTRSQHIQFIKSFRLVNTMHKNMHKWMRRQVSEFATVLFSLRYFRPSFLRFLRSRVGQQITIGAERTRQWSQNPIPEISPASRQHLLICLTFRWELQITHFELSMLGSPQKENAKACAGPNTCLGHCEYLFPSVLLICRLVCYTVNTNMISSSGWLVSASGPYFVLPTTTNLDRVTACCLYKREKL
jgi:hypothetical protein